MAESTFRKWITSILKENGYFAQSIEVMFGLGTPDIYTSKNGKTVWFETKYYKGNKVALRGTQLSWMQRHANMGGGHTYLVVKNITANGSFISFYSDRLLMGNQEYMTIKGEDFILPRLVEPEYKIKSNKKELIQVMENIWKNLNC